MTYAILAVHRGGVREVEICRVSSEASARKMAAKLAKEKFNDKLPGGKRTCAVLRYAAVRVKEVSA